MNTRQIIETRRGFPGTLERGRWTPLAIQGGDGTDEPTVHPIIAALHNDARTFFEDDVKTLDRAQEAAQRGLAGLLRSDGTPKYVPDEHLTHTKALLTTFDEVGQIVHDRVEAAINAAEREIAVMDGSDGFDRLSESEQARASSRREFVKEDMETQPLYKLEPMIRGMLAAGNRGDLYLAGRYLAARVESMGPTNDRRALSALLQDVTAANADVGASKKRQKLERQIEVGKWLREQPNTVRRAFDGSNERMLQQMRRQYAL